MGIYTLSRPGETIRHLSAFILVLIYLVCTAFLAVEAVNFHLKREAFGGLDFGFFLAIFGVVMCAMGAVIPAMVDLTLGRIVVWLSFFNIIIAYLVCTAFMFVERASGDDSFLSDFGFGSATFMVIIAITLMVEGAGEIEKRDKRKKQKKETESRSAVARKKR